MKQGYINSHVGQTSLHGNRTAAEGQGLVEYALLLALIAVAAIGTMSVLGRGISNGMAEVNNAIAISVADVGDWETSGNPGNLPGSTAESPTTQPPGQDSENPPSAEDGQPSDPSPVAPTVAAPVASATTGYVPPVVPNTQVPPAATDIYVPPVAPNTEVPPAATDVSAPPSNNGTPVTPAPTQVYVPPVNTNVPAPTAVSTLALPTPVNTAVPVGISCSATIPAGDITTLRNAVNTANSNGSSRDTICLTNSTYSFSNAVSNVAALPSITTPITIIGNGAILERGSGNFRLVNVAAGGALTLEQLSLRNGSHEDKGGAILNAGSLTLNKVRLTENRARYAGAIHSSGPVTITDSIITSNTASEQGGAILATSGAVTITNTSFGSNNARYGAALHVSGPLTIAGSTFTSNTASEDGAAILAMSGPVTISNTNFESNSSRYGSGLYLNSGTAVLTEVTLRSNTVNESGAGIYQKAGNLTVTGGLFDSNVARYGNSIYVNGGTASISGVVMKNSVAIEQGAGVYTAWGTTLSVANSAFRNNRARYGAAISNNGSMTVSNSSFGDNIVQENGGAVLNNANGGEIKNSCFSGNTGRYGGAVYNNWGTLTASRNWWGAASGPTAAMVNTNVKTDEFLTGGCPL